MNSKVNLLNSNSTSDKSPWVNVMIFPRDINMQGELVTKAGLCSWPVTHSSSTHSVSPSAHPVKLSLIPCHSDLCQATVTFGGQGFHAVHTRIVYLFVSVSVCCCLSSLCLSQALLTRPWCQSQTSCIFTRHLWLLSSRLSIGSEVLDFTCQQTHSLLSGTFWKLFHWLPFSRLIHASS